MKKVKLITITLMIAVITMIAFLGIYMPIQNRMENKVKDYQYAMDLEGTRNIRLTANKENQVVIKDAEGKLVEDSTVTDEQIAEKGYTKEEIPNNTEETLTVENYKKSKEIIEKRLKALNVENYIIKLDEATGDIIIELTNNQEVDYIISNLGTTGKFEIVDSRTDEVLMTNDDIKLVNVLYGQNSSNEMAAKAGTMVYLNIEFTKDGANKFEEISKQYVKVEENAENKEENNADEENKETTEENEDSSKKEVKEKKITLKVDNEEIMSTSFDETISNGKMQLSIGTATTVQKTLQENAKQATGMAVVLNEGRIPVKYDVAENEYVLSDITKDDLKIVKYSMIGIAILALTVLIVRYKSNGLIGAISYIGLVSLFLILIRYTNVIISIEGIFGIAIICILNYIFINTLLAKLKSSCLDNAIIKNKLKETYKEFFIKLIPICIIVIAFCFIKWIPISSFGMTMFWGITLIALYNVIITKSLLEIKAED